MFSSKKPYTSVTVSIELLTSEQFEEDDLSGIPDLVEAIKIQATGPTEAARALRKKLKYGNVHRQLRALTLLDGLVENAGTRFQKTFIDEPLLERLRVCGTSEVTDQQVKDKCKVLFAGWARDYKNTPGLQGIAGLYKELPRRKQQVTQERSKVLRETERDPFDDGEDQEDDESEQSKRSSAGPASPRPPNRNSFPTTGLSASPLGGYSTPPTSVSKKSKKDKKGKKSKPFNLEEEKPKMKAIIAESSLASTNLLNSLQFINRERERVSENKAAAGHFENCKMLRRHILRYIQHVESEQWLGALIHANDELVTALMTFEQLDQSIDADSDSDDELAEQAHAYRMASAKGKENQAAASALANLSLNNRDESPPPAPPPRPTRPFQEEEEEEEEDENDPFGDSNAVETPAIEKGEPRWKVV